MNIVDLIIIILILFGAVIGFKRGFTKSLVSAVGLIAIVVIAFLLKNPVSTVLYEHLPFFQFGGVIKGVTVLNIALYELLAFIIVLAILGIVLKILMIATSIFERILTLTIILGIPSKILGAIIGALEWFILVFIGLYVLNMPVVNVKEINNSTLAPKILNNTPILSGVIKDTNDVINEFASIKDRYTDKNVDTNEFNKETLDLFLKYNVVSVDSVDKLIKDNKLKIDGIDEVLVKYRKEEK